MVGCIEMIVIYALVDPRTGDVRYVGKTSQKLRTRLRAHINRSAESRGARHCASWIASLSDIGIAPEIRALEQLPGPDWEEAEKRWIRFYRESGAQLVNMTEGGGSHKGRLPTDEVRKKISQAAKKQFQSEAARMAAAEYGRKTWKDPETARRLLEARRASASDPVFRSRQAEAKRRAFSDPAYAEMMRLAHINGRHAEGAKSMWQRPEYREAQALARARRKASHAG